MVNGLLSLEKGSLQKRDPGEKVKAEIEVSQEIKETILALVESQRGLTFFLERRKPLGKEELDMQKREPGEKPPHTLEKKELGKKEN